MTLHFWRDLSIIWLSPLCFIGLAIPLVALYFMVRGMNWVHGKTSLLLQRAQGYSQLARQQTERIADNVSSRVVHIQGRVTRIETILSRLRNQQEN